MKAAEKIPKIRIVKNSFSFKTTFLFKIPDVIYFDTKNDRKIIVKSKKAKIYLYLGYFRGKNINCFAIRFYFFKL